MTIAMTGPAEWKQQVQSSLPEGCALTAQGNDPYL